MSTENNAAAILAAVCDALHIGSAVRSMDVVMTNIGNLQRRSACLDGIERAFFTEEVPDEDDPSESIDACSLSWGATPEQYVETFGELLAARANSAQQAAEPVEQPMGARPELGYVPGELDRTAPEVIYLQVDTAADNDDRSDPWTGDMDDNVSWCAESIGGLEIQYVRGDLIDQPKPEQAVGDGVVVYTYHFDYETQSRYLLDGPVSDGDKFVTLAAYQALASATPRPAVATPVEVTEGLSDVIEWHAREATTQRKLGHDCQADMHECYAGVLRALAAHPHTGYSAVPDGWVASFKAAVQAIDEDEQPITSACAFLLIDQCVTRNAKTVRLEFEDVYGSDGDSFGNWTVVVKRTAAPEADRG